MYVYFALQKSRVAVKMPYRKKTLNKIDATCEIYTAAIQLKTKLMHYNRNNVGNKRSIDVHNNITKLFDKVLIYLDIITTIQWQIYVRKSNVDVHLFHSYYCYVGPTSNKVCLHSI